MRRFQSFLAPLLETFIIFQKASGRWNVTYEHNLFIFDCHCARLYPEAVTLTQEMVDSWCTQRATETNNSCRTRIFVISNFVRYLMDREITDVVGPNIPKMEPRTYVPHAFTDFELENFFRACDSLPPTPRTPAVLTRRIVVPVFFRLLYSSGIRTNEARMLRVDDVNLVQGVLNIRHSKGPSQRYVVLHDTMLDLLARYNTVIHALHPRRKYFFPASKGSFLTNRWVVHNFCKLWYKHNTPHATAYELRHNYAVENINQWIGEGFEFFSKLVYLSKSMGHASLESTKYYFNLVPAMADILLELTGRDFDNIVPGVDYEKG
ncbi:integrase [Clostridiales bacterium PH28_bin88]|nr:integrase [Clostridiales bacterium PH28_bin88]